MIVTYKKTTNEKKNNRIEFWINNYDYEDGNDYLAKLFCKEFGMKSEEKVDYIYFSVIKLHINNISYELLWHEDMGNVIYSTEQDVNTLNVLEERLKIILGILNEKLSRRCFV